MDWDGAGVMVEAIARDWTREQGPGGVILLFDGGRIRVAASGGLSDLASKIPCSPETVFRYASISKQFLCALLMREGSIGFEDRLGDHLRLPAAIGELPVGRALDMTSGIPDLMEAYWQLGIAPSTVLGRDELLDFIMSLEGLNFPPGSEISYSNTGYRLVQAALEAKGIDYAASLHRAFFAPLGLGIVFPEDQTEPVPGLATGYWRSRTGWRSGRYGSYLSASGGLAGSALDLASWAQALLADRGAAAGLLAKLGAQRYLADGRPTRYGLGLARYALAGSTLFGHGGSLPGYKNHMLIAPAEGAGIVVLSNREETDAQEIALRAMAKLLGTEMPMTVAQDLPEGRFIAEGEPLWLEHRAGAVTFLGSQQNVFRVAPAVAENRSAELPIRLQGDSDDLLAEIGLVRRRFRRSGEDLTANPHWQGRFRWAAQHAELEIAVSDGVAHLSCGIGPLRASYALLPIAPDLALIERSDGPWRQRLCLQFRGDELRLIGNRARLLRFRRV
ncbi:CubicO group peptidase, beta-lactamase class C family [Rhizobiales bacterium GAS113]|nr:CubicO group peptidase, beta-lactamase class C family [Rhizobiales bacterium GAS113]